MQAEIFGDSSTDIAIPLPTLHGEGRIRLRIPPGVRCMAPRVMLGAVPLAVEVTRPQNGLIEVLAGPVIDGKLIFSVRAIPPVDPGPQILTVECEDAAPIRVSLTAKGIVRFIEGRSGWKVPGSAYYGDTVEAKLALRNDGTIALLDGLCYIALPAGVVPGFQCERREVDASGNRVLVMDLARLDVRATTELELPLFLTDPALERVVVRARIVDAHGTEIALFDSSPVAVSHRVNPMVTVHVMDAGPLRYGDELRCNVVITQGGAPLADAMLSLEGSFIQPIRLELGPLHHGERRSIPLTLRLENVAQTQTWTDRVFARLNSSSFGERTVSYNVEIPCAGRPLLELRARVSPVDETGAHRVDVLLENRGDGVAIAPLLRAKKFPDVRAVVDSLIVDGEAEYCLDGTVPIFEDGIRLPELALGQRAVVSFSVRSSKGKKTTLEFSAETDGIEAHAHVPVELRAAGKRKVGTFKTDALVRPEDVPEFEKHEVLNIELPAVERPGAPAAEEPIEPTVALEYPSQWSEIARTYVDDGQVLLGRHVVALLSWLPTGARGNDVLDSAAKQLAFEIVQMQQAGLKPLEAGFWGASGISIATPGVRTAAEAFAESNELKYPTGGQLTTLRWLAVQTSVPQELASWREAVMNALANAETDEDLQSLMTFTLLETAA